MSTKLKLNNTCILPIFLYGSDCWAVSRTDARKIDVVDQWCLQMLLGIKWHQFVRNDEVRRLMRQPKPTEIVKVMSPDPFWAQCAYGRQHRCQEDPVTSPSRGLEETSKMPRITWLSTIQQDLRSHNLTLPEAMDMAQNRSLWRMWSTYGATQSDRIASSFSMA